MQKSEPAQHVALVTGASRNIWRAIAVSLARSGCTVACFGRDATALDETAELVRRAGGTPSVFVDDARSNHSLEEFAAHAAAAHGGIDIVINNAGIVHEARPESTTVEGFLDVLQVKRMSQFTLARAAHASLKSRGGGVVVNIGSLADALPPPRTAAYCASKAGIDGLTRALAYDWATDNIRVLCVAPGLRKVRHLERRAVGRAHARLGPAAHPAAAHCRTGGDRRVRRVPRVERRKLLHRRDVLRRRRATDGDLTT